MQIPGDNEKNYVTAKVRLTSILDGSSQVKKMKVPFLRGRPWKILRNVDRADSSTGVGDLILGEMASPKASQKVLPSTSLTRTICKDFSRAAAIKKDEVLINVMSLSIEHNFVSLLTLKN
ncbi:hypothetical protein PanWU01x14_085760 [Parasponia andersonii]|uniref:Uncharacterized protein n=1 Tax=Parasponia andersonii TaxID=3476 RepID=A0A2P5D949_PARAD|nr:hypothetical protein PanWU01x14_085760 [Parasponia andersonii]